jgi:hypothetical protein
MFRRWWQQRRSALPSHGPVDVDGIRALIAEVLASLPPGAGHVEESRERLKQYPNAPEHDLDYLQLRVSPRRPDALDVAIDVYDAQGVVNVWVGDFLPIELTAPININTEPPRPFMDVIREALAEATTGLVDGEQAAPPWS